MSVADLPIQPSFPLSFESFMDFHPLLSHGRVLTFHDERKSWEYVDLPHTWKVGAKFNSYQESCPVVEFSYAVFDAAGVVQLTYDSFSRRGVTVDISIKKGDCWYHVVYINDRLDQISTSADPPSVDPSFQTQTTFLIDDDAGLLQSD